MALIRDDFLDRRSLVPYEIAPVALYGVFSEEILRSSLSGESHETIPFCLQFGCVGSGHYLL